MRIEVGRVSQVASSQDEPLIALVRILIEMFDPARVNEDERRLMPWT